MKCEKDKETVSRYLSDLMDEAERAGFEAHIAQCEECRAEVARFRRMLVALGDLPRERAPLSVARAIDREAVSRLKGKRPVSLRARWSATVRVAAAAVIVLAVMCSAYFLHLELTRPDKGSTIRVATRPENGAEKIPAAGESRESVDNWLQERLHDEKAASFARTLSASAVLSGTDLEDVRKKADSLEFGQLLDVIKAYRERAASGLETGGKASVAAVDASVLSARLKQVYLAALNKAEKPSDVGELVESGAVYFPPAAAGEVTLAGYEPENAGGSVHGQNGYDKIESMREIPDKKTEPLALPKGMEGAPETRDEIPSAEDEAKRVKPPAAVATVRFFHQNIVVASAAAGGGELTDEQKRALTMVLGSVPEDEKKEGVVWTINRLEQSLSDEELALMLKEISGISDARVIFGPLTAEIQPLLAMDDKDGEEKRIDLAGRKKASLEEAMERLRTEISITLK